MGELRTTPDRLPINGVNGLDGLPMVGPRQCIAPRSLLAGLSAPTVSDAVLATWPDTEQADERFPVAALWVTSDSEALFDPELSLREPIEVQFWRGGRVTVEVEFVGAPLLEVEPGWAPMRDTLTHWAAARGIELVAFYNDRGRSLSEVWNARFTVPAESPVDAVVELGLRAIAVGEFHRDASRSVEPLLELLRAGDGHALVGTAQSASVRFRPAPPGPSAPSEADRFRVAGELCALANAPRGGVLVLGAESAPTPDGVEVVRALHPGPTEEVRRSADEVATQLVYPPIEGLSVESVPLTGSPATDGLVIAVVPAQDAVLTPFLVHGALNDARLDQRFVSIVETRGADLHVTGIAALHATLIAGRARMRALDPTEPGRDR